MGALKILISKYVGKSFLGRPRRKKECNTRMNNKDVNKTELIDSSQERNAAFHKLWSWLVIRSVTYS